MYEHLILNENTDATLIAIALNQKYLNSQLRQGLIHGIIEDYDHFSEESGIDVHYAGLPYIRTVMSKEVKAEFLLFMALAAIVTSLILFLFFIRK